LCLICGEPALYDMSTLHRQPGAALWVCEEHVTHPDVIELLAGGVDRLAVGWASR
jgi:hypothetical protein